MSSPFASALEDISSHAGVLGCLVVGEDDGIIIDSELRHEVDGQKIAALAASLFRKAGSSTEAAGLGDVRFLRLQAQQGHLLAVRIPDARDDLAIVALVEEHANVGILRASMMRLAGVLA